MSKTWLLARDWGRKLIQFIYKAESVKFAVSISFHILLISRSEKNKILQKL